MFEIHNNKKVFIKLQRISLKKGYSFIIKYTNFKFALSFKTNIKLRNNQISNKTNVDEIILEKSNEANPKRKKSIKNKNKERNIFDNYDNYYEGGNENEIKMR